MKKLVDSILKGKWDIFQSVVENEALSLHSLMMSSNNPYILMHPRSLAVIEKIKEMRGKTGAKCCFTLDAGPNIHLLCPRSENAKVKRFIESDLKDLLDHGLELDEVKLLQVDLLNWYADHGRQQIPWKL